MANNDYAIYIDNDGSDNYAPLVYRTPATLPAGGTRLPLPYIDNATQTVAAKAITGATNATPIVLTCVAHGCSVDDIVYIRDVGGNTAANGTFVVSVVADADTCTLRNSAGNAAYTSGGTLQKIARTKNLRAAIEMGLMAVVEDKAFGN